MLAAGAAPGSGSGTGSDANERGSGPLLILGAKLKVAEASSLDNRSFVSYSFRPFVLFVPPHDIPHHPQYLARFRSFSRCQ